MTQQERIMLRELYTIQINGGKKILLDKEDYLRFKNYVWSFDGRYASRCIARGKKIYLHREIMNAHKGMIIDHINHDKLDNRRANLRFCSPRENIYNTKPRKHNLSGLKGVSWFARDKKWKVSIMTDGVNKHLGYFSDKFEAAEHYNSEVMKRHGNRAYLNTIPL